MKCNIRGRPVDQLTLRTLSCQVYLYEYMQRTSALITMLTGKGIGWLGSEWDMPSATTATPLCLCNADSVSSYALMCKGPASGSYLQRGRVAVVFAVALRSGVAMSSGSRLTIFGSSVRTIRVQLARRCTHSLILAWSLPK